MSDLEVLRVATIIDVQITSTGIYTYTLDNGVHLSYSYKQNFKIGKIYFTYKNIFDILVIVEDDGYAVEVGQYHTARVL